MMFQYLFLLVALTAAKDLVVDVDMEHRDRCGRAISVGQDGSLLYFWSKPMCLCLLWSTLHIIMHCKVRLLPNLRTFVLPSYRLLHLLLLHLFRLFRGHN